MENAVAASHSVRDEFEEHGFVTIPNALGTQQIERLCTAVDKLTARAPDSIHNVADIFGKHDAFLELLDLPTVLPTVCELLGTNIWVNHSHFNANPSSESTDIRDFDNGYGWHRDGGAIHRDLAWPPPLMTLKVAFYLTDLSKPGAGQTYFIRDSHKTGEAVPGKYELPASAFPMMVEAGTAVLFDRRLIHSIRSANRSGRKRRVIFVQYAFRWIAANDEMRVERLRKKLNPVQKQLLGLTSKMTSVDGAKGRSNRYYPGPGDIPLAFPDHRFRENPLRSFANRVRRLLRR